MAGPHAAWWAIALIAVGACQSPPSAELPDIPEEVQADDPQRKPAEYWAARLNSPSSAIQQEALGQLGAYGRDASAYAPLIVPLLRDPDRNRVMFDTAQMLSRRASFRPILGRR